MSTVDSFPLYCAIVTTIKAFVLNLEFQADSFFRYCKYWFEHYSELPLTITKHCMQFVSN